MKRFCLALDLKDDATAIAAYEEHHKNVWPEVLESITDAGIEHLDIYRVGNRLFMIMETQDDFSFAKKAVMDENNNHVQQWEHLMREYQQALPFAQPGEKWVLMDKIFSLQRNDE